MSFNVETKPCPSFPGYSATESGLIISPYGIVLSAHINNKGYKRVNVNKDGSRKKILVHIMVADAFLGPADDRLQVRHFNDDTLDNRPSNLRYGTVADNISDRRRNGGYPIGARNPNSGSNHPNSKLSEKQVLKILKMRRDGFKIRIIAEKMDVCVATIEKIIYNISYLNIKRRRERVKRV